MSLCSRVLSSSPRLFHISSTKSLFCITFSCHFQARNYSSHGSPRRGRNDTPVDVDSAIERKISAAVTEANRERNFRDTTSYPSIFTEDDSLRPTRLFIHNIDWEQQNAVLEELQRYGPFVWENNLPPRDSQSDDEWGYEDPSQASKFRSTSHAKGRLFVRFERPQDAAAVLRDLQDAQFGDRCIVIELAGHKRNRRTTLPHTSPSTTQNSSTTGAPEFGKLEPRIRGKPTLVFKNMPYNMDEEETEIFFSQWGNIMETFIARSANGMNRGFGFVVFEEVADMEQALQDVDGMELKEGLRISVEELKNWRNMRG